MAKNIIMIEKVRSITKNRPPCIIKVDPVVNTIKGKEKIPFPGLKIELPKVNSIIKHPNNFPKKILTKTEA